MSPQSPRWSETAWKAVEDVYEAILRQPFVRELMQGTLPREKFLFYLGQDAHYLASYCRSLAHTASRLTDTRHVNAFLKFASDGIAVEKALHESFLNGEPLPPVSPTCAFYTSVETAAAMRPVEVEAPLFLGVPARGRAHPRQLPRHCGKSICPMDRDLWRQVVCRSHSPGNQHMRYPCRKSIR